MCRYLKIFIVILLIPLVVLAFLIIYASITDYHPEKPELLQNTGNTPDTISDSTVVNLLIWNIGCCGLDRGMDFFYDGGTKVRTTENQLESNFSAINHFVLENDSVDFILLQEVDIKSHRSYRINQVQRFTEALADNHSFYVKNYDVFFVPLPLNNSIGGVNSGLFSSKRFIPGTLQRYLLPGRYDWTWIYDSTVPSNRRIDIPYTRAKTRTTVIDLFLLLPNIRALGCRTIDLGFENSDHQPVITKISLHSLKIYKINV
jgi:hypothetical protein